jgi:hypothetical protein
MRPAATWRHRTRSGVEPGGMFCPEASGAPVGDPDPMGVRIPTRGPVCIRGGPGPSRGPDCVHGGLVPTHGGLDPLVKSLSTRFRDNHVSIAF